MMARAWWPEHDDQSMMAKWLGHVLRMMDDRLPKNIVFAHASWPNEIQITRVGFQEILRNNLKEIRASWDSTKCEILNRLDWRGAMCSHVGFRQLVAAMSCQ